MTTNELWLQGGGWGRQSRLEEQDEQVWVLSWASGLGGTGSSRAGCGCRSSRAALGAWMLLRQVQMVSGWAEPSDICWGTYVPLGPSWLRPPPCLDQECCSSHFPHRSVLREVCSQSQRCMLREQRELRRDKLRLKNAWEILRKSKGRTNKGSTVFVLKLWAERRKQQQGPL